MALGQVPAGVRTSALDQFDNFLNIPKKGAGDPNLSARKDHDILNNTSQILYNSQALQNQLA